VTPGRAPQGAAAAGVMLGELDLHLLNEGTHAELHRRLGAHLHRQDGADGAVFSVWAPSASAVVVAGDWNGWAGDPMRPLASSGVWEAFVPGAAVGHRYKFRIRTAAGDELEKADPMARHAELPPGNASIVASSSHVWSDDAWCTSRPERQRPYAALSVYELHLGSWRRVPEEGNRSLGYREIAPLLADHCDRLGFTHVELMPLMEHPFDGSWGYQVTGFFAPTARFGTPDDLRWLVDYLHGRGIGVIFDWVPAHFPDDPHGLAGFDGTALYEHADPREGRHPDWGTLIFNYGRNEVRSFLVSSAVYWLEEFHADGLRVDAVASMLYRDYSRAPGEWVANAYGGRENLEAVAFLRQCTETVVARYPGALLIAEESTSWPGVTAPVRDGGLGFTHKWDLGWMHDTLDYLRRDPDGRSRHQNDLTFRGLYAHSERWMLPLSHDEVVHGKGSLLTKMPGDAWQQRANLRLLLGYQWGIPGGKLLFMGGELGQRREWDHDSSVDWHLLVDPDHAGLVAWVAALNAVYRSRPSLAGGAASFNWIACTDAANSVFAWRRTSGDGVGRAEPGDETVWVASFTAMPHPAYRIGLPRSGRWRLLLNGDDVSFGGSGYSVVAEPDAESIPWDGLPNSMTVELPPLALLVYAPVV
jgi:1,4-alpha-glucan branching enzyme